MLHLWRHCLTIGSLLLFTLAALADGFMVPVRPEVPAFSVRYHKVNVRLERQIATTQVDQAFQNHANRQVEGTYIFPLADGLSISKFSMFAGAEELTHRILEKEEARRIYTGIVSRRQDPALLEWVGTRMIQARVFPIEPNADKRVRLEYQEVLKAQGGVVKYVYPLKTEKLSAQPLQECTVAVEITSAQPIRSVYSPTHPIVVQRDGEFRARAVYSATNVRPDQDLILYYTTGADPVGVDLLTYRDPARGDGYFLLLAAPKAELSARDVQPKDVVFILDTSGSMSGEKIAQAKAALKFCVDSLDRRDRFNVIAFSSEVRLWQRGLQAATRESLREALAFIDEFKATGGTNIDGALQTGLELLATAAKSEEGRRPPVVVFLTDGQPTIGETNVESILRHAKGWNGHRARIFTFGVGADYHAHFLDKLADDHNGSAENVLPRENIEIKVSDFFTRVASPLLMDLQLDWGEAEIYDQYPKRLPDLFKGSQLLITGRYKPSRQAETTVRLSGEVAGQRHSVAYRLRFPTSVFDDESIPRLWATRKMGYLEDQMRLHGTNPEVLQELIALSKEYGILSQYTAFLVDMDVNPPALPHGATGPAGPAMNAFRSTPDLAREAEARVTRERAQTVGSSAIRQSMNSKAAANAPQMASTSGNVILNDAGDRVQLTQMRNVSQRSFVQNGRQWVDVNYRPSQMLVKVRAFSPAYFQLANSHPRMAQYLSLGESVMVAVRDTAIQIGPDGQEAEFTPAALTGLQTKIDAEFGRQQGTRPVADRLPMARGTSVSHTPVESLIWWPLPEILAQCMAWLQV